MTGGTGNDRFDFNIAAEIGNGTSRDVITDFDTASSVEKIDLSTIDANGALAGNTGFTFRPAAGSAFTGAAGQLRWFQENLGGTASDKTIVEADTNGDSVADFQLQLTGLKTLSAGDFAL